jgi:dTDP-glucose 4,6-dehydratase
MDKLTHAANLASLASVAHSASYEFRKLDICDREGVDAALRDFAPDAVIHLAATTHVNRSIAGSKNFIDISILGTYTPPRG